MASKVAEDQCNTETEEGTIALQKKRSRRVSFAEITSVHVFDRDDEYETPPDPKPNSDESNGGLDFLLDSPHGDDSTQNEEYSEGNDSEIDARRSFFRPMESPSPGSTIGSATSNDEDNFFGPVSASFIRPRRLSDSAVSDENHDITMDSTAFSLHFRSLARSDSGGDLKTPTGVHLSFEEKTPTQNALPTNVGSSMVLTGAKKPISASSTSVDKLSGSSYSDDMSLVGENPHKYDYARISPGLDALLAEGRKDLHAVSDSDKIIISRSTIDLKSRFSPSNKHGVDREPNDGRGNDMGAIDAPALLAEPFSSHKKLDGANGGHNFSPVRQTTCGFSSEMHDADVFIDKKNLSPNQLIKGVLSSKSKLSGALEMMPNLDFDAANCGTPSNPDMKVEQTDVFAPREYESSLAGSLSSLSAKRRRIVLDSASPSKNLQFTTPSQKLPGSLVTDETRKHCDGLSSIQKSISKLEMLKASPFSSAFKVNIDSASILSKYNRRTPSYNTVLDTNREDAQIRCVDTSVGHSEDQLCILAQENGEPMSAIDVETSENTVDVNHAKGPTGVAKDGISTGYMSPGFKLMEAEETLLSQFPWSGNKLPKNFLTSGDPTKGMVVTSGTGSLLAEITLDHAKDKKKTGISPRTVPSSEKNTEKSSLASKEYWSSLSGELNLYDQDNRIKSMDSGYDGVSSENVRNGSLLTRAQSRSTMIEINHSKESTGIETMFSGEKNAHALQDESGAVGNFQTPLADKMAKNVQSTIFDGDLQIGADPVRLRDLTTGCVKAYSRYSASPFVLRGDNEPPHHKQVVELFTQSPSRKELHDAAHNDRARSFVMEDVLSPNSSQLKNSFASFSVLKRTREDMIPRDSDFSETARNRRPKHHRSARCDSEFFSEPPNESNPETSAVGRETRLEHWADVFSKFSADAKQLISPSTNNLNLQAISVLEDVLVNLRRLQIHDMLCTDIRSQKSLQNLSDHQRKKIAEAKLFLLRFVHEQAKLQLLLVKREKLLKKVQLLSSGIQESQMLKLNTLPHLSLPRARDAHVDSSHCQPVDLHVEEGAGDKVTALRQVLNSSERKITSLTKSFHTSCKMKGEPNHVDTILLVNDHLKKKARCRFIRLELQLWDVDNLESSNGHHNIVLNYLGFIIQRIAVNVGPVSSIVVSNNLNGVNILKNFPNMDVCTAFAFVLNANSTRKYVGSRSLIQETQITSSVLGNLLDVIEEVRAARVDLQNLPYTSFCSPSVERLELHLHFIDFKSGRKVALALNMSCLKWGIYPSEAIPYLLEGPAIASRKQLPEPLSAEIRAVTQTLKAGYSRIIRLCRCVSQVVQAWSG
ncbi:uncharacterized protein LOC130789283 [Actinidia eriantha]|uniref:uncharacterized protein LOC130789283 n=1 Tax=Actinidia eriantha TaxID=165200 RepID=UPI002587407E|nr:uncharacterized protein LOC130789283 [Actinidia eriantha]